MASGQTLIFGIMKVVNLAQGAMVILGAYLSFQLFTSFGIDPFVSIPITTVVMFGVGVATEVFFLRPLRKEERAELSLLVTFAVALLLEGLMVFFWSTNMRSINNSYVNASWSIAGYQIPVVRVWAFVLSAVALGLLFWLLNRTKFGRAVRASVQNPESATLLGVRSETISALGFGLGAATAASAGAMYAMLYPSFNAGSHYDLISLLLSIVLLGGLGSIGGAIVGALVISLAESIVAVYDPVWAPMSFFVVLLLVLLLRPRGLFGTAARGAI
jgi:branched-chain amino acid transport system permease protein